MSSERGLPLLPLRGLVLFPGQLIPLLVKRKRSYAALLSATDTDKKVFLVQQKDSNQEQVSQNDLFDVGVEGRLVQLLSLPNEVYKVLIEVQDRAEINELYPEIEMDRVITQPFISIVDIQEETLEQTKQMVAEYGKKMGMSERFDAILAHRDPAALGDGLAAYLPLEMSIKQKLLDETFVEKRLSLMRNWLQGELEKSEAEGLSGQVSNQAKSEQSNPYQDSVQQNRGGSEEAEELVAYRNAIESAQMMPEAKQKALYELKRLKKMRPMSSEATVVRSYLDWLISYPWSVQSDEHTDLVQAREVLDANHRGLETLKDRIIEHLAVQQLHATAKQPILCLVGPPGVGKTSVARAVADATGRAYVRQALGGVRDEAEIRGHRRTYIGAMPGKIAQSICRSGVNNPLFLLDEVDKMASDFHHGDPAAALLEALDPEQNTEFRDHYLNVGIDLSEVLFICTANTRSSIPAPLLDRMELIELPSYSNWEKVEIAQLHLWEKQCSEHGITEQIGLKAEALRLIIERYTREAGVRQLERCLASMCRKLAKQKWELLQAEQKLKTSSEEADLFEQLPSTIDSELALKLLGKPKYRSQRKEKNDHVGVVKGLAVTPWGGEVLTIEAALIPGKGGLILTGRLGDWLKESAQAALTALQCHSQISKMLKTDLSEQKIHIHYPGNALRTDGPSAGLAMSIAILSAITGIPARGDVAMTGEISLQGRILQIGGVKEKILAAHRIGIKKILLPSDNEPELDDLPEEVKDDLEIVLIEHLEDAIQHLFRKESLNEDHFFS
ncbi:MAG: endopeptidase La [Proteobacteria bacterium]|nr:endopeptidase La [Pseudomonadota bacterium]